MVKDVLLVEPDPDIDSALRHILRDIAHVTTIMDFSSARTHLLTTPPNLLVTNLRLRAHNGIHLVLLADRRYTQCVVYASVHDAVLARQVQADGAFYERLKQLPFVLPSYVRASLPSRDLRNPEMLDRRGTFRGGRRAMDLPVVYEGSQPAG
jgi:DNA-binding NtrC family response regulator